MANQQKDKTEKLKTYNKLIFHPKSYGISKLGKNDSQLEKIMM
jgi:hypothetical protein